LRARRPSGWVLGARRREEDPGPFDDFHDDVDSDDEPLVRVPRRGGRTGRSWGANRETEGGFDEGLGRGSTSRRSSASILDDRDYQDEVESYNDFEDHFGDDGEGGGYEDTWDLLDSEGIDATALFEDVVIPNPLLDSIDPDGAADRFPELARDPKFWFDMLLFLAFLNFLSSVGPRDPLPDLPWF
jgi:hypothetical protein